MVWSAAPPGSENRARTQGSPRNLGGPALLREERRRPDGREWSGATVACTQAMAGANDGCTAELHAETNEACGMSDRKSERFVVPLKPGNQDSLGLGGGKGAPEQQNRWRARWKASQGHKPSQRNNSG